MVKCTKTKLRLLCWGHNEINLNISENNRQGVGNLRNVNNSVDICIAFCEVLPDSWLTYTQVNHMKHAHPKTTKKDAQFKIYYQAKRGNFLWL